MSQENTTHSQRKRFRLWFARWMESLGLRPASSPPEAAAPYPDYVPCPHCGEPEVEVWCTEKTARCHHCGRTFDHVVPPDCSNGDPPASRTKK